MRAVDLSHFELLTVPQSQGELMRALTLRTQEMGADRFAYIRLPDPIELLSLGVYPRVLTNFSDSVVMQYMRVSDDPFSMMIKAVETQQPGFLSEAELPGAQLRFEKFREAGFVEGVIFPIKGSNGAVLVYMFKHSIDKDWVKNHVDQPMSVLASLVDMAITAKPELCPPFGMPGLTERVQTIFRHKVDGLTNEQIGSELGIKSDTVKKAIRRFSERQGGVSTLALVHRLTKLGVL